MFKTPTIHSKQLYFSSLSMFRPMLLTKDGEYCGHNGVKYTLPYFHIWLMKVFLIRLYDKIEIDLHYFGRLHTKEEVEVIVKEFKWFKWKYNVYEVDREFDIVEKTSAKVVKFLVDLAWVVPIGALYVLTYPWSVMLYVIDTPNELKASRKKRVKF